MGPVKQDPSIVMRVELPDSPGTPAARGPLYLRGVAYNRYDGKSWSNNPVSYTHLDVYKRQGNASASRSSAWAWAS